MGAGHPVYRYSYSANDNYCVATDFGGTGKGYNYNKVPAPYNYPGYATVKPWVRYDGNFTGRMGSIKNVSEKVLLYCQDPANLDDGIFVPNPYNLKEAGASGNDQTDMLSGRHNRNSTPTVQKTGGLTGATRTDLSARGNVTFVDGHGDFIRRRDSVRQKYTSNPYPDPTGW